MCMSGNQDDSASTARVLLLFDETPLCLGIRGLLQDRTVLQVVCSSDPDVIVERIGTFKPHAVVMSSALAESADTRRWLNTLRRLPGMRLITLSTRNTLITIDQGGVQMVKETADLLDIIQEAAAQSQTAS